MTTQTQPLTAEYDPHRSTKWTECYPVPSRRNPAQTWLVTFDNRSGAWRCPCEAGEFGKVCAHVKAAKEHRIVRWWRATWAKFSDETLANEEPRRRQQLRSGDTEDRIAYDTLGDEIARRMSEAAAA